MEETTLPSRFVSQDEIEETNKRKEDAWKAAYARIGQEPPKQAKEEVYDGRSLAEKLAANKAAKQEEYENSHKLSAQFRSLDPDEIGFLDEVALKRYEEERKVKEGDQEELKGWRATLYFCITDYVYSFTIVHLAVQARDSSLANPSIAVASTSAANPPSPTVPKSTTTTIAAAAAPKAKKNPVIKAGLKGVIVTKKRTRPDMKPTDNKTSSGKAGNEDMSTGAPEKEKGKDDENTEDGSDRKRRRVE